MVREETVLQGMIGRIIEIGRMWEKNQGDENLETTIAYTDYPLIDQQRPENVEYLNYLDSMVLKCARYTRKLNQGLPW
jgi:hypothetical protein